MLKITPGYLLELAIIQGDACILRPTYLSMVERQAKIPLSQDWLVIFKMFYHKFNSWKAWKKKSSGFFNSKRVWWLLEGVILLRVVCHTFRFTQPQPLPTLTNGVHHMDGRASITVGKWDGKGWQRRKTFEDQSLSWRLPLFGKGIKMICSSNLFCPSRCKEIGSIIDDYPETNIASENWWLEDEFPFGLFSGATCQFQGGY